MFRSIAACILVVSFAPSTFAQPVVIGFEDLSGGFTAASPGTGYYGNAEYLVPPASAGGTYLGSFSSAGAVGVSATFNNYYEPPFPPFGAFSSAWSYSTVYNPTTAGFTNQYAAYNAGPTGSGGGTGINGAAGSATYAIANNDSQGSATITLPTGYRPTSMMITNTTYAYLSMLNGDGIGKQFGLADATHDGKDWFMLTIYGRDAGGNLTGTPVNFMLADFRSNNPADHFIVNHWSQVDLTSLGASVSSLEFDLTSSDVGKFGMNTPAYFAMDNLVLTPVPEPGSILAIAAGAGLLLRWRKRRMK